VFPLPALAVGDVWNASCHINLRRKSEKQITHVGIVEVEGETIVVSYSGRLKHFITQIFG
jgi:hypothetical protein